MEQCVELHYIDYKNLSEHVCHGCYLINCSTVSLWPSDMFNWNASKTKFSILSKCYFQLFWKFHAMHPPSQELIITNYIFGITMDKPLSWQQHVTRISNNLSCSLYRMLGDDLIGVLNKLPAPWKWLLIACYWSLTLIFESRLLPLPFHATGVIYRFESLLPSYDRAAFLTFPGLLPEVASNGCMSPCSHLNKTELLPLILKLFESTQNSRNFFTAQLPPEQT